MGALTIEQITQATGLSIEEIKELNQLPWIMLIIEIQNEHESDYINNLIVVDILFQSIRDIHTIMQYVDNT